MTPFVQIDVSISEAFAGVSEAFADRPEPLTGNPAAVCLLPRGVEWAPPWLQKVVWKTDLPEFAFFRRLRGEGAPLG